MPKANNSMESLHSAVKALLFFVILPFMLNLPYGQLAMWQKCSQQKCLQQKQLQQRMLMVNICGTVHCKDISLFIQLILNHLTFTFLAFCYKTNKHLNTTIKYLQRCYIFVHP